MVFKGTENYRIKGRILKPVQTAHLLTVSFTGFGETEKFEKILRGNKLRKKDKNLQKLKGT